MRKIIGLGAAVLLVMVIWTAGWFWAASEAERQVELLALNDGESAPRVTCGSFAVTGFPFRFDFTCSDAELVAGDETITLKGLKGSLLVYNPTHLIFSAEAPYTMANAFTGSASRFDFTGLEGSARLVAKDFFAGLAGEGWRIARVSLVADGVDWFDTVLEDLLQARASRIEAHLMDIPEQHDPAKGIAGLAAYLTVAGLDAPALDITAGEGTLEAEVLGLPDDLADFSAPDALQRWQATGGSLKLYRLAGNQPQPDERFDITGEASLTGTGLVNAQLNYTTTGVLDRFAGMLPVLSLAMLKGKPADDGSFSNSLGMVDGQLRLLTQTIMDIPPLW